MKSQFNNSDRRLAKIALFLIVPLPSLGVIMATTVAPGAIGKAFFTVSKFLLVALPFIWRIKIEKKRINLPKITKKQINLGIALGFLMAGVILISYILFGNFLIDSSAIKIKATEVGIASLGIYLAGFFYWSFINSFIEECVWRGFIYRYCRIFYSGLNAIILSALFFTLHHTIALFFYTQDWLATLLGSLGVFLAGIIWSICYRSSNFWSCYISHILADLGIALIGWDLLFN